MARTQGPAAFHSERPVISYSVPTIRHVRDAAAIILGAWGAISLLTVLFVALVTPAPPVRDLVAIVAAAVAALAIARRLWLR